MRAGVIAAVVLGTLLVLLAWRHVIPIDPIEALGFATGGACVWLAVKENIWNWPIGIANNAFYVVVFSEQRLFADMSLQIAFALLGCYGWYEWLRRDERRAAAVVVTRTPATTWIAVAIAVALSTVLLSNYLTRVNDAAPLLDAATTTLSLGAQYLMTRKYLENWLVWISVDVISIGLYAWKHLGLTAVLYGIFLCMCVVGFRDWRKSLPAAAASARA